MNRTSARIESNPFVASWWKLTDEIVFEVLFFVREGLSNDIGRILYDLLWEETNA